MIITPDLFFRCPRDGGNFYLLYFIKKAVEFSLGKYNSFSYYIKNSISTLSHMSNQQNDWS